MAIPPARDTATLAGTVAGLATSALVVSAETPEDPADQKHRHAQETADATMRRWLQGVRFTLAAVLLIAIAVISANFAISSDRTADEKAWARTSLTALATAVAGYFVGKKDSS